MVTDCWWRDPRSPELTRPLSGCVCLCVTDLVTLPHTVHLADVRPHRVSSSMHTWGVSLTGLHQATCVCVHDGYLPRSFFSLEKESNFLRSDFLLLRISGNRAQREKEGEERGWMDVYWYRGTIERTRLRQTCQHSKSTTDCSRFWMDLKDSLGCESPAIMKKLCGVSLPISAPC